MERYINVKFQEGPAKEVGINGCQVEAVLDVCLDRLRKLNAELPCRETSLAITKLEESLMWLNERTRKRQLQGVEGTGLNHKGDR